MKWHDVAIIVAACLGVLVDGTTFYMELETGHLGDTFFILIGTKVSHVMANKMCMTQDKNAVLADLHNLRDKVIVSNALGDALEVIKTNRPLVNNFWIGGWTAVPKNSPVKASQIHTINPIGELMCVLLSDVADRLSDFRAYSSSCMALNEVLCVIPAIKVALITPSLPGQYFAMVGKDVTRKTAKKMCQKENENAILAQLSDTRTHATISHALATALRDIKDRPKVNKFWIGQWTLLAASTLVKPFQIILKPEEDSWCLGFSDTHFRLVKFRTFSRYCKQPKMEVLCAIPGKIGN